MENVTVTTKSKFLDEVLSDVNFENKVVLDAGTGSWSARFLAKKNPGKIVCVAGLGDLRKKDEAKNALLSTGYKRYQIILGNLTCENLFPSNSFDFILADNLLLEVDGFAPLGICELLQNLYNYLRERAEIVIVNSEAYVPFRPEYELTPTYELLGDAQLEKRSNRDLIETLSLLSFTSTTLKLMFTPIGNRYPSKWICNWLTDVGFKELKTHFFDVKVNVDKEFTQYSTWARQIIAKESTPNIREGLLEILEEVVSEYKRRNVTEDDFFLRRNYVIRAKKELG